MAQTTPLEPAELAALANGPAGSDAYLRQKERALKNFENHIKNIEHSTFSEVLKCKKELERCLKSYFFGIRVMEVVPDPNNAGKVIKSGKKVPPKLGYAKNVKSVLFNVLLKEYQVGS